MEDITWYSLALGDGVSAYSPTNKIQEVFFPLFAGSGCPCGMGVFSRYDKEHNLVTAYFTPAAHVVAKIFGASPCEKPPRDNLGFLVGDESCWDLFFPEGDEQRR